jgi:glycosyltransferase involved in cell wall biosynthesis
MFFVTAYLGGEHGTAKSSRDFLRAMLACAPSVHVVAPLKEDFPDVLCGRKLSRPIWFKAYGVTLPDRFWRLRPEMLRRFILDRAVMNQIKRLEHNKTVIVNGWANYGYWRAIADCFRGHKVMVVRESPRSFTLDYRSVNVRHIVKALSEFDSLIFVSDIVRKEWLEFDELREKATYYLPNCCEEEEVEKLSRLDRMTVRASLGCDVDDFVVLCPGRIEYRKGQDLLVDIVAELARCTNKLRVVFVGNPLTPWGRKLVKEIKRGNAGQWCTRLRSRPDILDLLYASDVLAVPSRAEAMPRTILEAMALGTPVVAAAVGGIPELIEDGNTGILFQLDEKDGLLQGLLTTIREPENCRRMAEQAKLRYWGRFSRKHQFDRMAGILDHVG